MAAKAWVWLLAPVAMCVIVLAFVELAPARLLAAAPAWVPHPGRTLALKDVGGASLVLQLDAKALRAQALEDVMYEARQALRAQQIDFSNLRMDGDAIVVRITDPAQVAAAMAALGKPGATGAPAARSVLGPDQTIRLAPDMAAVTAAALQRSVRVVTSRVRAGGARDPVVSARGADQIVVEAPTLTDLQLLEHFLGKAGRLTFQMVDDQIDQEDIVAGRIPPDDEMLSMEDGRPLAVKRRAVVDGANLIGASASADVNGRPAVIFRFDNQGSSRFATVTRQNVGKLFAIVLDKQIVSAPRIDTPITGGDGIITGAFTSQSAHDLAVLLQSGALPAPLTVVEARLIQPG